MTTSPIDMTSVLEVDGQTIDLVWVVQPRIIEAGWAWLVEDDAPLWGVLAADFWPVESN
jgi:hypothetical protein